MSDSEADHPLFQLFNEIGIIDQLVTARFSRVLAPDLNPSEFGVLNHFVRVGGVKSPSRLARIFQMTKPSMTAILGKLERKGFVEIVGSEEDRRRKIVSITQAGRAARERAIKAVVPLIERVEAGQDMQQLRSILPTLVDLRSYLDAERNALDGLD